MKYQGDIGLYLSGSPVVVPSCMIYITQPTVREIVQFNETNFLMAVQLLSDTESFLGDIRNEEGNSELKNMSDFQILLIMVEQDPTVKKYFSSLFELIFPEYEIVYGKMNIDFYITEGEEKQMVGRVTPFTFEEFQKVIKELFSLQANNKEEYNPTNEAAKAIADKLKKARQKRDRLDGKKHDTNVSIFGTYASVLAIGMNMDINVFFNYTPFQLYDAFQRYWLKSKYDFYQKIASTPLMDTSKMEEPEE